MGNIDAYRDEVLRAFPKSKKDTYVVRRANQAAMDVLRVTAEAGDVPFVRAGYSDGEAVTVDEYFLVAGQLLMLREVVTTARTTTEMRYYFDGCALLGVLARESITGSDLNVLELQESEPASGETRTGYR